MTDPASMRIASFLRSFGAVSLGIVLSSCAASPAPHPFASRMAHDAATASHSSPAERRSYDQAIRRLCQELDRRGPDLAIQQLRQSDVKVILPKIPLPLQSIEIPKNSRPSSETIGIPIVLGYDTKNFPLYPPEGLFVDASALVRTIDGKTSLEFSTDRESIRIDGADYKLAIDPTGAGLHLERQARKLAKSGFISMLRPSSMERRPQIYLLDPYDPAKIPLLMVHGLQSTPVAFASMVNALRSDPDVRAKYQIWQFYYPSGSPVLANAADLRDSLSKTLHTLDPKGEFPSNRRIVVIGHSMGGVISHSLVSSSDGALWASIFRVPPAQLQGDQEAIRRLTRILDFKRDPRVSRVIFMAAPHRGSPMADSFIGWFGNSLARLSPMEESGFSALARKNPEAMMPAAARFYDAGRFSAVRTLSPKSTALLALADLPISIPYHSVIGQQRWEPTAQGSDGVVPYASSHLDGADSELIVRSGHGVIGNADAIREVIRILHEEGAKP